MSLRGHEVEDDTATEGLAVSFLCVEVGPGMTVIADIWESVTPPGEATWRSLRDNLSTARRSAPPISAGT